VKNYLVVIVAICLLSACVGDRITFSNRGEVYLLGSNLLCIKSKSGDAISFYSLSSSENKYSPEIISEFDINKNILILVLG